MKEFRTFEYPSKETIKKNSKLIHEGLRIIAVSKEMIPELESIFIKLNITPVWIGGIAVGLLTEPITTYDFDIIISQQDFLTLKKQGKQFGIQYGTSNDFNFNGEKLQCLVEGEKLGKFIVPSPGVVRETGFLPSIEGIFLLKLSRLSFKDREHLARLEDVTGVDENKLKVLIDEWGYNELWEKYLKLKEFWGI